MSSPRRVKVKGRPGIYYRDTPNGRAYEVTWLDATGRRRWRRVPGFDNLDAAKAELEEEHGRKRRGEKVAPAGVRFGDVAERYLESRQFRRLGPWTQKSYRAVLEDELRPRFRRLKIAEVDADAIAGLVTELERRPTRNGGTRRRSTVENALKPLRAVMRQAVKEKLLTASPFAALDRDDRPAKDEEPHEAHEWTDAEVGALLAASRARARGHASRTDYSLILEVAAKAGLRLGEVLGLDWPELELVKGAGAINVRQQWTRLRELAPPKAGSRRRVPIADELVARLQVAYMAAPDKGGPVFASMTGTRLSHRNVQRRGFDPAAEDAKIAGVTFHSLRHAYGSKLAERGLTARQIADAMGHKRTTTTELYVQRYNGAAADERVRAAMSG
jgi:integrase